MLARGIGNDIARQVVQDPEIVMRGGGEEPITYAPEGYGLGNWLLDIAQRTPQTLASWAYNTPHDIVGLINSALSANPGAEDPQARPMTQDMSMPALPWNRWDLPKAVTPGQQAGDAMAYPLAFMTPDPLFMAAKGAGKLANRGMDLVEDIAGKTIGDLPSPIGAELTAWHGTPHKWEPEPGFPFGRPRKSAVGSGVGAAAYGHGVIYLSENPKFAGTFKNGGGR